MISLTAQAARQVADLRDHYERLQRLQASRNLDAALEEAARRIEGDPASGLAAPRAYPSLARPGQAWIKAGAYWIRYTTAAPSAITGVFYETADIPGRA